MQSIFKKVFSLLVIAAMLVSFTACNNDPDDTGSSTTTQGNQTATTTTVDRGDTDSTGSTDSGATNSSGSTVSTTVVPGGNNTTVSGKLLDNPVTLSVTFVEHPSQPFNTDAVKFKEITEKTNVTLKFNIIPQANYNLKTFAMMAANNLSDITYLKAEFMKNYSTDMYVDITDRIATELPNYNKWFQQLSYPDSQTINGRQYGFIMCSAGSTYPVTGEKTGELAGLLPVIRYDILEKHNIAVPTTWDEWFVAMRRLKALYPNSYVMSGRDWESTVQSWSYQLGCQFNLGYDTESKKYYFGVLEPEFKTVLKFMADCYSAGILDPAFVSRETTANTWNQGVKDGKIFFWIDNVGFSTTQTLTLRESNPNANMSAMPLMTNSFGEKRGTIYTIDQYAYQFVVSTKSKYVNEALKFMDWCYSDEGMYINSYGKEGVSYIKNADGSVTIPDSVISQYRNASSPDYNWMSDYGLGQLAFTPLLSSMTNMSAALKLGGVNTWNSVYSADWKAGNLIETHVYPAGIDSDVSDLKNSIEKYIRNMVCEFISGKESLDTVDQFIAQVKQMGAESVIDAYNKA